MYKIFSISREYDCYDDILKCVNSQSLNDNKLEKVMWRTQKHRVKLNKHQCNVWVLEINSYGIIFNSKGQIKKSKRSC